MEQKSIFIILEKDSYEEFPTIVCACSTKKKLEKALSVMKEKIKNIIIYFIIMKK